MIKNLALVTTYFDYPDYYLPVFYQNAMKYFDSKDIHIIRYLESNLNLDSLYSKLYHYKIVKNIEYYKTHLLDRYEYLLFADATDTNIYRPTDSIISDFLSFDANIVFCGEKCAWPPIDSRYSYDTKPKLSSSFYLNSGLYIGYTDKIIEHMDSIIQNNRTIYDDQGHWTIEYLLSNDIVVDQYSRLFFSSLNSKNEIQVSDNRIILPNNPYFVHDNGPYNEETLKISEILNETKH
jgi:hypothetical protein